MRFSLIDSIWHVIFWNLIIVLRIVGVTMSLYPARCSVFHLFRWDVNLISSRGTRKPSNDKRRAFLSSSAFYQVDIFFLCPLCELYTSCVERSDKREELEVGGWHESFILKRTWQNSNNLLGSPSSALSYLRLAISVSNRELARPIHHCPTWVRDRSNVYGRVYSYVCAYIYMWVIESRTSRWKMSGGVTGIRIRGNTSRKNTGLDHRSCIRGSLWTLADVFLRLCTQMWCKREV